MALKVIISLSPVILFFFMLLYLDSLKLVRKNLLGLCLLWGLASSGLSYLGNTALIEILGMSFPKYSLFIAPVVEEFLKLLPILYLIRKNKIGFMIDGAIYGFSIGAAFSVVENLYYLFNYADLENNLLVWIIRGVGTAIMHGSATALFAMISMSSHNRKSREVIGILAGAFAAILLHALFNGLVEIPLLSTLVTVLIIPVSQILIFNMNEKSIRNWLELEFDSEVNILKMIRSGQFSTTKTGQYLLKIKTHFPAEMLVDIYCYISVYLELSIQAKSRIMMKEAGIIPPTDPDVQDKLRELTALEKSIGKGGLLAISPVLRMNRRNLWKLTLLEGT
jgi:RsiW-degrading membrane proteinase PrsW (M82 family)